MKTLLVTALTVLGLTGLIACGDGSPTPKALPGKPLVGTFKLDPGTCTATGATGSYFRMINRNGTVAKGPYFANPDSPCKDKSLNVQVPGTDGGLVTGTFQPAPNPAFDKTGNALARRIVQPGSFTAIKFGVGTAKVDPDTGKRVDAPAIFEKDGKLRGEIAAWTAAWNNLYFNQGSPKPDGTRPGQTLPVTGTYDAKTGTFVLEWASQVVGGPFDGFAGYWHLTGTFVPKGS